MHLFTVGASIAIVLGLLPLLFSFVFDTPNRIEVLAQFSTVAWFIIAFLLMRHRSMLKTIQQAAGSIGLSGVSGGLTEIVETFANESTRYHRAQYALRVARQVPTANLSENVWRIAELAYEELAAAAVELSLFDEESGHWTQGVLIGHPRSYQTQSMLDGELEPAILKGGPIQPAENLIVAPVQFAGTMFGALRVELAPQCSFSESDRQVLQLLASQGGILLVDARFTEEVLRMRRLSEETSRAKTGFLANLSHEIRGPLAIILNGVELSLEGLAGDVTDAQKEILCMIKESGDHLLDLVNDVLDFAKVEAGKITTTPVDIPVAELLDDICSVVRTQALAKEHKLILEPADRVLGAVCDKRHARQMLINFLTNAIKYTPEGGSITVAAQRYHDNQVKISVSDTGIGIPDDQRAKVFGAFERVDHAYAMSQGGTGLGMPLTRRLAEVNGGSVGFDSTVGKGSTFWVALPATEIQPTEDAAADSEDGQFRPQGHNELILLVDNATATRSMLETYLTEQGFVVICCSSAADALRQLRERNPALVIIENDMPDLSGEEMVAAIRSSPYAASIPLILLSARAFVFDIERFLKLGVDRCLSKPVSLGDLAITARRLIDEKRNLDAPPRR
ncbi:MAG: response regulator [Bdellovibrionales bacterium]|nr:response regulator [Bdellovibrionales bacterium]